MEFHPVAEIFPMMTADEHEVLCLDIATNGLREPVLLAVDPIDGIEKIADGRNRYKACVEVNEPPKYRIWDGIGDLKTIVVSLNLKRRHLSESQRAMVAARLANMKQGERTDLTAGAVRLSQTAVSQLFSISPDSIQRAGKVQREGIPELVERVESGDINLTHGAQIAAMSPEKQKRILKKGRQSAKKIVTNLKTQSLRQTAKGFGTCVYCNPELTLTDAVIMAFAQRVDQRCKEALRAGRSTGNYGPLFENIAFELADAARAAAVETYYEKIFAVIDGSDNMDDHQHQVAEKTDIQRITKIPWQEFNDTIAEMLYYKKIEAVKQGGKGETARGARKMMFRRMPKPDGDLTYEIDEDDSDGPDIYLGDIFDENYGQ